MACPALTFEHDSFYMQEIWSLSGVGIAILCLRVAVRSRTVGVRNFEWDDWMILPVLFLAGMTNAYGTYIHRSGAVAMFKPDELLAMVPCQIENIEFGFKALLIVWYTVTALTWAFKTMMLLFLHRTMRNLGYDMWLKIIVVSTIASYVAVLTTISCTCQPMSEFWRVLPPQGPDSCRYSRNTFWSTTIGNLLTDFMMICLPIPIIFRMRAPLLKRLLLGCLLTTGVFAATTVVVRMVFTMTDVSIPEMMRWGARELLAANCAVNLPFLKPLTTNSFWRTEREFAKAVWLRSRPRSRVKLPKRLGILPSVAPISWTRSVENQAAETRSRPASEIRRRAPKAECQHPTAELVERTDETKKPLAVAGIEKQQQDDNRD